MVEGYLGIFILSSVRSSIAGNCSLGMIFLVFERNVIYFQNIAVKKDWRGRDVTILLLLTSLLPEMLWVFLLGRTNLQIPALTQESYFLSGILSSNL
jgi:hypothetical protein